MAVIYNENANREKISDVVLHTVGQHSSRKDEVLASTFLIEESHDLVHNETALLTMSEDVKVIGA